MRTRRVPARPSVSPAMNNDRRPDGRLGGLHAHGTIDCVRFTSDCSWRALWRCRSRLQRSTALPRCWSDTPSQRISNEHSPLRRWADASCLLRRTAALNVTFARAKTSPIVRTRTGDPRSPDEARSVVRKADCREQLLHVPCGCCSDRARYKPIPPRWQIEIHHRACCTGSAAHGC
jgi:hypothetical protein